MLNRLMFKNAASYKKIAEPQLFFENQYTNCVLYYVKAEGLSMKVGLIRNWENRGIGLIYRQFLPTAFHFPLSSSNLSNYFCNKQFGFG